MLLKTHSQVSGKGFGRGRAFSRLNGETKEKCTPQKQTSETNRAWAFASSKTGLEKCKTFSPATFLRFIEGHIATWAMPPTQRMRFKTRCCLLTNTWTSSRAMHKCRLG